MKSTKLISLLSSLVTASMMVATTSYALDIPGLQTTPNNERYASRSVSNNNVQMLKNLSPQALEKQIETYLPHAVVRPNVISVTPVSGGTDEQSAIKNGQALLAAIEKAKTINNPVTLTVDAGTYKVENMPIPENVSIKGLDTNTTKIEGGLQIEEGDIAISNVTITASNAAGIDIRSANTVTLDNVVINADAADIMTDSTQAAITISNSKLLGRTPVKLNANANITFRNVTFGATPTFFGDYTNSAQLCILTTDVDGTAVPLDSNPRHRCVPEKLSLTQGASRYITRIPTFPPEYEGEKMTQVDINGGVRPFTVTSGCAHSAYNNGAAINQRHYTFYWDYNTKSATSCTISIKDALGASLNFTDTAH